MKLTERFNMWGILILKSLVNLGLLKKNFNKKLQPAYVRVFLLLLIMLGSSFSLPVVAFKKYTLDDSKMPVPVENQLFYLQRDPDRNTVVYKLNAENGVLDKDNPITAFWIRYEEQGQRKELSFIQRKLAYGLHTKQLTGGVHEIRLVSYPTVPLYLSKSSADNQYHIYTQINQKKAILDRIFVRIDGGSLLFPNVKYVEISGKDVSTGKGLAQRLIPNK
jgi:hypothetical protein